MEQLILQSKALIERVPITRVRPLLEKINRNARFVGIRGTRGVGKTTLLLQHAIRESQKRDQKVLYVSMEHLYFRNHTLYDLGTEFVRNGGELLLLDEVHRYAEWAVEIKLLYDTQPDLRIWFTSSSIVEITRAKADLSRRVVIYDLYGLSFREYLIWNNIYDFPVFTVAEVLAGPKQINQAIAQDGFKPLPHLKRYWRTGYYPYAQDDEELYFYYVNAGINTLLDVDVPALYGLSPATTEKLKKLLVVITESVPFKPNMTKLADYLGVNRETVQNYLYYLYQARLVALLPGKVKGNLRTQKPEKVYLDNTNLLFAIPGAEPNLGTLRETFFHNALTSAGIAVGYAKTGDFMTDEYIFEVGGRNKTNKQIAGQENAYRVVDDFDLGVGNRVPLWGFGLLR